MTGTSDECIDCRWRYVMEKDAIAAAGYRSRRIHVQLCQPGRWYLGNCVHSRFKVSQRRNRGVKLCEISLMSHLDHREGLPTQF
jgi:hypothetical protein